MDANRPPCWPDGQPCPNPCASALYDRVVSNRTPLTGPWAGWRMAGRVLVSPDGDRISAERLRGILFREAAQVRMAKRRPTATVVTLPARERFVGSA